MAFIPNISAIFIKTSNIIERVELDKLLWIQSDGNYCNIQLKEKKFVIKKSLVKILEFLPPKQFVRVHMKFIVAVEKIKRFDLSTNKLTIDQSEITVGPRYRADLIKLLRPI